MIDTRIQIVPGFSWFGKNIGIKDNTFDFGGILSRQVCSAAGVFTKNTMPGAPVIVGKEHLSDGRLQAIIVNSNTPMSPPSLKGLKTPKKFVVWWQEAAA